MRYCSIKNLACLVTLKSLCFFHSNFLSQIQPVQLSGGQLPAPYVYLEVVSKHFSKSEKIPITYDNGFLFIHTDKPIYTPHQSGNI